MQILRMLQQVVHIVTVEQSVWILQHVVHIVTMEYILWILRSIFHTIAIEQSLRIFAAGGRNTVKQYVWILEPVLHIIGMEQSLWILQQVVHIFTVEERVLYNNPDIPLTSQEFLSHSWISEFYYRSHVHKNVRWAQFILYLYYLRPHLLLPSSLPLDYSSFLLAKVMCVYKLAACGTSCTSHSPSCYCTLLRVRIVHLNSRRPVNDNSTYCWSKKQMYA